MQALRLPVGAAVALALLAAVVDAEARDRAVPREYKRLHPCPATGLRSGPCPGWQIDHVRPLKCGGADHVRNLQWLTVDAHRAKTKREARWCLRKKYAFAY